MVPPVAAPGAFGKMLGVAGKASKFAKGIPGGGLIDAGVTAVDTFMNAETPDEKAEGYGSAAGGLAGTMAGMAAGAAIGSVVPVIGTAIGGAVGALLGGLGGDSLGGMLGKAWFGSDDKETAVTKADEPEKPAKSAAPGDAVRAIAATAPPPAVPAKAVEPPPKGPANAPGDVVRSMAVVPPAPAAVQAIAKAAEPAKPVQPQVDQQFTWSPNIAVTVQGDVKDPDQLARDLVTRMRPHFEEIARQAMGRQLFDAPHV